jgi:hypothetical protein
MQSASLACLYVPLRFPFRFLLNDAHLVFLAVVSCVILPLVSADFALCVVCHFDVERTQLQKRTPAFSSYLKYSSRHASDLDAMIEPNRNGAEQSLSGMHWDTQKR